MSISLDVQDLENFPGVTKKVTLDTTILVPSGSEGDEKYLISASTSAYSDVTARTTIQSLYIAGGKIGWAKSSGFKGTNGKFALDSTHCVLGVKMDATISGTTNGYYNITLDHNNGILKRGDEIAMDIQNKLHALTVSGTDAGFSLAYKNCSVKFEDNKFYISSGTISNYFTGPSRSSVRVGNSPVNDCAAMLGFDQQVTSELLSDITILEAPLLSDYTTNTATLVINMTTGVNVGDALCITDGTNTDYFTALGVATTNITVATSAANNFIGIGHSYTVANGAYVQILQKADPNNTPNNYYNDVDELLRYMAKIMINQIDFA